MFTTYGRPSEIDALTVDDVVSPAAAAGAQFADTSVTIRDSELHAPTKVGAFDDTLPLDSSAM
eukprot:2033712-Lingulodinium_polyedra.AAC.1